MPRGRAAASVELQFCACLHPAIEGAAPTRPAHAAPLQALPAWRRGRQHLWRWRHLRAQLREPAHRPRAQFRVVGACGQDGAGWWVGWFAWGTPQSSCSAVHAASGLQACMDLDCTKKLVSWRGGAAFLNLEDRALGMHKLTQLDVRAAFLLGLQGLSEQHGQPGQVRMHCPSCGRASSVSSHVDTAITGRATFSAHLPLSESVLICVHPPRALSQQRRQHKVLGQGNLLLLRCMGPTGRSMVRPLQKDRASLCLRIPFLAGLVCGAVLLLASMNQFGGITHMPRWARHLPMTAGPCP